jgi:hypothetical protein
VHPTRGIWRFPEMGVPPNHPFAVYRWTCSIKKKNIKNNIKKNKNSYWGTTVYGNAHSKHDDMSGGFKDFFLHIQL